MRSFALSAFDEGFAERPGAKWEKKEGGKKKGGEKIGGPHKS